ncbi:MAG: lytic transglycosylase domain-containing protein [bacterium]|nr:lytic transglycosylase domain-containing protein [bacterium]
MLESLQNVLGRIQDIKNKFYISSYSSQADDFKEIQADNFKEVLNKSIYKNNGFQNTEFDNIIKEKAYKYQIDPKLVKAIIKVESNFNPKAVSPKGAMGLMQLINNTAKEMAVKDTFDPQENIEGGVKYLKYLLKEFNQNIPLTLAAYNAGPKRVKEAQEIPNIKETQDYVRKVLNLYRNAES